MADARREGDTAVGGSRISALLERGHRVIPVVAIPRVLAVRLERLRVARPIAVALVLASQWPTLLNELFNVVAPSHGVATGMSRMWLLICGALCALMMLSARSGWRRISAAGDLIHEMVGESPGRATNIERWLARALSPVRQLGLCLLAAVLCMTLLIGVRPALLPDIPVGPASYLMVGWLGFLGGNVIYWLCAMGDLPRRIRRSRPVTLMRHDPAMTPGLIALCDGYIFVASAMSGGVLVTEITALMLPNRTNNALLRDVVLYLDQATDGEWLVLGPALLWAGAQRLVVTGFPVRDSGSIDRPLIGHLLAGHDLVDSLRSIQTQRLTEWRATGHEDAAPAIWSAHVALGAFTPQRALPAAQTVAGRYVDDGVIKLLDSAAEHAAWMGRTVTTPTDILGELALYGFYEDMPAGRRILAQSSAYAWSLGSLLIGRLRRATPSTASTLTNDAMDLIHAACAVATSARHRLLTVEHLLVATLAATGFSPALGRWVSHWDGRHPETVKEIISESQDGYQAVDLPTVKHLAPHLVRAIYHAFSAEVPQPADRERVLLDELP